MPAQKRYSLSDVRRSYTKQKARAELRGELPAYLLYRPLSFPVALLLLRLRVPIVVVTLSCGAIAPLVLFAALYGGERAYLQVAALGLAFHVLDCVDGNMARTTGQSSRFGALLDGFCDYVFWSALFLALGVLAEREAALSISPFATELGLGAALVVLLQRDVRQHFAILYGERPVFAETDEASPSAGQWLVYALSGLENLYVFAIGLGGAFGALGWVLLGVCGYVIMIALAALALTFRGARARDAALAPVTPSDRAQDQAGVLPTERE